MNEEIIKILNKAFITTEDIAILACCSMSNAKKHKTKIRQEVLKSGRKIIDSRYVSLDDTLKYLDNKLYMDLYNRLSNRNL